MADAIADQQRTVIGLTNPKLTYAFVPMREDGSVVVVNQGDEEKPLPVVLIFSSPEKLRLAMAEYGLTYAAISYAPDPDALMRELPNTVEVHLDSTLLPDGRTSFALLMRD